MILEGIVTTYPITRHSNVKLGTANKTMPFVKLKDGRKGITMDLKDLLMLVQAGYTRDEIVSMVNAETEKKQEQEADHVKGIEPDPEKKSEKKSDFVFDYDKLADNIISKIQENNRSTNLANGKNDKSDWLNQLSLKF